MSARCARSWPNGFSMTTRRHGAVRLSAGSESPERFSCSHDDAEEPRRDRQVERVVAAGAAHAVEVLHGLGEPSNAASSSKSPGTNRKPSASCFQTSSRNGVRACSLTESCNLGEVLVGPVAPREPDEREPRRQQAAVGQVVDGRHELLAGQVAGDAEEHEAARAGDPRQPAVARVAERVDSVGVQMRVRTAGLSAPPPRGRRRGPW